MGNALQALDVLPGPTARKTFLGVQPCKLPIILIRGDGLDLICLAEVGEGGGLEAFDRGAAP
jgi:hypothetical protein